jgi:hypothetical protein
MAVNLHCDCAIYWLLNDVNIQDFPFAHVAPHPAALLRDLARIPDPAKIGTTR